MIMFYSGSTNGESLPERVLCKNKPGVMLTYYEMDIESRRGDTIKRFERHAQQRKSRARKSRRSA
jgi:hypothetical protein